MEASSNTSNGEVRDAIISSIRTNLAASLAFDKVHSEHHPAAEYMSDAPTFIRRSHSQEELIDNFRASLESLGAHFAVVNGEAEARDYLREMLAKTGLKRIAVSDADIATNVVDTITDVEIVRTASKDVLFDCDLGITSAQWAIAETGTLVLESDAERHRLTSLVPPIHLCLLRTGCIRQTMGEILEMVHPGRDRTITFITGASRTSDIELTLAIGVHGPRELHVLLFAD